MKSSVLLGCWFSSLAAMGCGAVLQFESNPGPSDAAIHDARATSGDVEAAVEACEAGACACPDARSLCNGLCVAEQTDPNNCGACGASCPTGAACVAGTCDCASPATICTASDAGSCTDLNTDSLNCGACGAACSRATPFCLNGTCAPTPSSPSDAGCGCD